MNDKWHSELTVAIDLLQSAESDDTDWRIRQVWLLSVVAKCQWLSIELKGESDG